MSAIIGFVELGVLILAWLYVIKFIVKGFCAKHAGSPAVDGFAAVMVA